MDDKAFAQLKKGGKMRQVTGGLFSVRLHLFAGRLTTAQTRAIAEAADRFGGGRVHITSRQGIEIPDVTHDALAPLEAFLAAHDVGMGVCGPTVRTVTACQGTGVCPSAIIDSPDLAGELDRRYYGQSVPHKFKMGVSGCANNCLKAEENDVGFKGWIEPRWVSDDCIVCDICATVCPVGAVTVLPDEERVALDLAACIGCGDCITSCVSGSMVEGAKGYAVYAGGKLGRVPRLGRRVAGVLPSREEALDVADALVEFFRLHGEARERFGATLQRTGLDALEAFIGQRTRAPS